MRDDRVYCVDDVARTAGDEEKGGVLSVPDSESFRGPWVVAVKRDLRGTNAVFLSGSRNHNRGQ